MTLQATARGREQRPARAKSTGRRAAKPAIAVQSGPGRNGLEAGDELEMRLARVMFWEGSYARRGIDLERHFASAPLTITDLDLLAIDFDPQLRARRTIGEAKSGTGKTAPKPLDRALWLAGVARLVGADLGELVTAVVPNARVRATVADLHILAMSVADLDRRESAADIASVADTGSHGPTALARVSQAHSRLRNEPELERALWFLRSEVWFHSPWIAAKRTLGVLRVAKKWFTPTLDEPEGQALRCLLAKAVSVLTLKLVALCGDARHTDPAMWADTAREKLAEGAIPLPQMRTFSDHVDTFVTQAVALSGGTPRPDLIGAFMPTPPEYTDAFIELSTRPTRILRSPPTPGTSTSSRSSDSFTVATSTRPRSPASPAPTTRPTLQRVGSSPHSSASPAPASSTPR